MDKLKKILRKKNKSISSTFISSYIPRKCGIATYTKDLTRAINLINPYSKSEIVALIKPEDKIDYPPEVKLKINQYKINSYIKAADYINKSKADIVVLEHEFGLYGGDFGEYIIKLIELLKKPLIVTTHTIPDLNLYRHFLPTSIISPQNSCPIITGLSATLVGTLL